MTDTLIALLSIFIGIMGAYAAAYAFKKYAFDIVGNSIAGVFGSIFFIKSFGRLGFDPTSIMESGNVNLTLFMINAAVSFFGGAIGVILIKKLEIAMKG